MAMYPSHPTCSSLAAAVLLLLVPAASCFASPSASAPAADVSWAAVAGMASSISAAANPAGVTVQQEITSLQRASQGARDFYTRFASDPRAPAAKKLEVVAALQSVQLGGAQYGVAAQTLAAAYRADPSNPVADRFDVALIVESMTLAATLKGRPLADGGAAYAAVADKLYGEFGGIPAAYGLYVHVMRATDQATAFSVAQKLSSMAGAPEAAKAEAARVIGRNAMIGKPLPIILTGDLAKPVPLGLSTAGPTLVYVWSNRRGTGELDALAQVKASVLPGTQVIYVAVNSDPAQAEAARARAPLPGAFYFQTAGFKGVTGKALGLEQTPYVFVLNRQGVVAGCGRLEDLPALFYAASR
jgi:hypothetical protein